MKLFDWMKGVFSKMIGRESIQQVLKIAPIVSDKMKNSIELWEKMYMSESPWLSDTVHSLGIPALIASEKARMATLEMEVKITGDSDKAQFVRDTYKLLHEDIRGQLEYGIALGGFVIKPYVTMGPNGKYKIKFSYTKASDFYPLAFAADGSLTSAAFLDRIVTGDKMYTKVEIHTLVGNDIRVTNQAFVSDFRGDLTLSQNMLGTSIELTAIPEWSNIAPTAEIKDAETLLFAYWKNPEANTVDLTSPLGTSGYSRAINLIKHADEQYSNLLWEFEGGQMAIDVDRTALNPMRDSSGKEKMILPALQDRLFRRNLDLGSDDMYNVFAPALRDDSIINGLNNILMHIEDVCSLSRGTLSNVAVSEARTATELKILKQRAFAANADIQKSLQATLETVFKIVDVYCELYHIVPDGDYEVAYKWDDSILVDKDSERQIDLLDVNAGLMSKVEYRMKWFGETRTQAEQAMKEIQEEHKISLELQQQAMASNNPDTGVKTEKQDEQDTLKRAQESKEHTTEDNKLRK